MSATTLFLSEWEHCTPDTTPALRGLSFARDDAARQRAAQLTTTQRIEILEAATGLAVQTTSFVGNVTLGPLQLVIRPKLEGLPLLNLLRYAYRLRNLLIFPDTDYALSDASFQDLLIAQMAAEVEELLARGLHREYERVSESLHRPRGKLNFQAWVRQGGLRKATLPCIHHPRIESTLLNQVLLAGLHLGAQVAMDVALRVHLRRLIQVFALTVAPIKLSSATLASADRVMDRRTLAYRPALTLIKLLAQSSGLAFDRPTGLRLSGFLFDMNRFFQALLARFLQDFLPDCTVQNEYQLKEMFAYVPGYNPRHRQPPVPRPDFAVFKNKRLIALIDAKYRDLWERTLPRDMLYQVSIYALSQPSDTATVILYPTLDESASEARIAIREPLYGNRRACVVLRPVNLFHLEEMLTSAVKGLHKQDCGAFARELVSGSRGFFD